MRTQEHILARIEERKKDDIMGFEWHEYTRAVNYENAKKYLDIDQSISEKRWKEYAPLTTQEKILDQIKIYMDFAWDKANNFRGISAERSIQHYIAWAWLHGDDEICAEITRQYKENYEFYGKNILVYICEKYSIDHTKYDDGVRQNSES